MTPPHVRGERVMALSGEFYNRGARAIQAMMGQELVDSDVPQFVLDPKIAGQINLLDTDTPPFRLNGTSWARYTGLALAGNPAPASAIIVQNQDKGVSAVCLDSIELKTDLPAATTTITEVGLSTWAGPFNAESNGAVAFGILTEGFTSLTSKPIPTALGRKIPTIAIAVVTKGVAFAEGVDYDPIARWSTGPAAEATPARNLRDITLWPGQALLLVAQTGTSFSITVRGRLWRFGPKPPAPA